MESPSLDSILENVPADRLDRICEDGHLNKIALWFVDWRGTAPFLGLKETEEEEIDSMKGSTRVKKISMLRKWRRKFGKTATYRRLIQVFYDLEEVDVVDSICSLLTGSSSEDNLTKDPYDDFLRCYYRTHVPTPVLEWPPMSVKKHINLYIVKNEDTDSVRDAEKREYMVRGNVERVRDRNRAVLVKDLFKLDDAPRKVILVEGAPGTGKSTLSWHICQKWESAELFQQFSRVLLIELRDLVLQSGKTLADIIPCHGAEMANQVSAEIAKSQGDRTLFILDGWDELPLSLQQKSLFRDLIQLPHNSMLRKSTVLVTSRPMGSGELRLFASSIVEVVGFLPNQMEEYFSECLGDQIKTQTLMQVIRENPTLESCCYVPLNAAVIVYTFKFLGERLPTTFHGILSAVILSLLSRSLEKDPSEEIPLDIETFDDLPMSIRNHLDALCKLAYHGMKDNKITFSSRDLRKLGISTAIQQLDLVHASQHFGCFSRITSYSFLHLLFQEFLAAIHLSKLSDPEQLEEFKKLFSNPKFYYVLRFYSGITKLCVEGIHDVINGITANSDSSEYILALLRCLYEAQDISLCQSVASNLGQSWSFGFQKIATEILGDALVIGYFLACASTQGNFHLKIEQIVGSSVDYMCKGVLRGEKQVESEQGSLISNAILDLAADEYKVGPFHQDPMLAIANMLTSTKSLHTLHLSCKDLRLGFEPKYVFKKPLHHLAVLLTGLIENKSLIKFDFTSYKHLDRHSSTYQDETNSLLLQLLQTNMTLQSFNLTWLNIGDLGASYIAEGLRMQTTLKELCLSYCHITHKGLTELVSALLANKSLKLELFKLVQMSLEWKPPPVAISITQVLMVNSSLVEVELENDATTATNPTEMTNMLQQNTTLQKLKLPYNQLADIGATCITKGLVRNHTLVELNLRGGAITDMGVIHLTVALRINKTLQVLDLSRNFISGVGVCVLGAAMPDNKGLLTLILGKQCSVNASMVKSFKREGLISIGFPPYRFHVSYKAASFLLLCLRNNMHLQKLAIENAAHPIVLQAAFGCNIGRRARGCPDLVVKEFF